MRNLSSVRHLIGGGIHELVSWMEIKFSLAQLFEDFKKGDTKKRKDETFSNRRRKKKSRIKRELPQ